MMETIMTTEVTKEAFMGVLEFAKTLYDLPELVRSLQARIDNMVAAQDDTNKHIADLAQQVVDKSRQIDNLQSDVRYYQSRLEAAGATNAELREALAKRDSTITQHLATINDHAATIAQHEATIAANGRRSMEDADEIERMTARSETCAAACPA